MRVRFKGLLVNAGEDDARHRFKIFRLRGGGEVGGGRSGG